MSRAGFQVEEASHSAARRANWPTHARGKDVAEVGTACLHRTRQTGVVGEAVCSPLRLAQVTDKLLCEQRLLGWLGHLWQALVCR